ncbi:hypothetical protein K3181_13275 [Qipengyuania sp. YG27]|uniref:Uncharacterized protein n=1 Tax=Qipengyuania mesophila TaxID=2867246 RepID=A0ABS7JXZ0_9SPHN|nr:hypothetical protein [Qipengyuania mesophila]MBX7502413.1 hypothetical protein [Qipengyuania mesophila]
MPRDEQAQPDDKPFGWRPLTEEDRKAYEELGWSEDAIASIEAKNAYTPIENAVLAYEMSAAILAVATKHLGSQFLDDVLAEFDRRVVEMNESGRVEDEVEAKILEAFVEGSNWKGITQRMAKGAD